MMQTIEYLSSALRNGEITSVALTQMHLDNIKQKNSRLNAFITVTEEQALQKAYEIDQKLARGESLSPLAGIPMSLKDNICTRGIRTTCASRILEHFVPQENATVVDRLDRAGAILLGKVNMDEFGMGSSNETSYFGKVHNPVNETRIPGGSSGGSAVAVAAEMGVYSLGTDTGGSIRQPASYCGVVGLKPTYGAVSRHGVVPLAMSFDQVGPLTRSITDAGLILNEIAGYDPKDKMSVEHSYHNYLEGIDESIEGMKIALPKEYFVEGLSPEVRKAVIDVAKALQQRGAIVEEITTPHIDYAIPTYYMITCVEATAGLSVLENNRTQGFGKQVKKRILLGNYVSQYKGEYPYYEQALKMRTLIREELVSVMKQFDVILAPTTPTTAFELGGKLTPVEMYLSDIYTVSSNIAGLPALSMPCGVDQNGLPIGIQLIGGHFTENKLLRIAKTLENIKKFK
ncbi:MAG: Asp-tRNA(Asn)/Glu-tRNA(Gln) amidotransferase subunit GatA [Cellulosilyticaceae bacterium]